MNHLGIVVIGRNEGARLSRCLASIGSQYPVVYVDSGSTDQSVAHALSVGVKVVELDMSIPFTAARARNAGRVKLGPAVRFIQFVDGDCELRPGWIESGHDALAADASLAVAFGRLREAAPETSVYNWLCSVEWSVPPGEAQYFGGIAMLRANALDQAGGYPGEMIAGEEPDLAVRLRAGGWRIASLDVEMAVHDAAMTHFSQWWRRAERSGHAYAELEARHPGEWHRRLRAALFWGAAVPGTIAVLLIAVLVTRSPRLAIAAASMALLPLFQFIRVALREARVRPWRAALTRSWFLLLDKTPHAIGIVRYRWARFSGRRTSLIEYKAAGQAT